MPQHMEKIKQRLESAFKPLRCVVELWDYQQKARFKIFDHAGQSVLEVKEILLRELQDADRLEDVINEARERALAKGFVLD